MSYRIGIVGASGRTGRFVVAAITQSAHAHVAVGLVSPLSKYLGEPIPETDVIFSCDSKALAECDGVIDFSQPGISLEAARVCAERAIPILVGTTGYTEEERQELESLAHRTAMCIASNTSIGATVLGMACEYVQRLLGPTYDCELMEIHHRTKRDAPSGTARSIVKGLAEDPASIIFGRQGMRQRGEIGVVSLRGGDTPADHTVYFLGEGDRIELTHRVHDRKIFGTGAAVLIERLIGRSVGLYSVRELLQINPASFILEKK
jgi:4-hydroxy-tetrahydrodipicolinate reductase